MDLHAIFLFSILLFKSTLFGQITGDLETGIVVELESCQSITTQTLVAAAMEKASSGSTYISIYRSVNQGISWQPAGQFVPDSFYFSLLDPALSSDASGNFYLIFMAKYPGSVLSNADLVFYGSDDDGLTWTLLSYPHKDDYFADYPQLITDHGGNIYLVYSYFVANNINDSFIYQSTTTFRKSTDGGISWSPRYEFVIPGVRDIGPDIALKSNQTIVVTFGNRMENNIYFIESRNLGETWSTPLSIGFDPGFGSTHHITKPITNSNLDNVVILSHIPHKDTVGIYCSYLNDEICQTDFLAIGSYAQGVMLDDGSVHVVYNSLGLDSIYRLNYVVSGDNGRSFTDPITLHAGLITETGKGEYQSILKADNNLLYVTFCDWADSSKAKIIAFMPHISDTPQNDANNFVLFPNPTRNNITVEFLDNISPSKIKVMDLNGKLIVEKTVENRNQSIQLNLSSQQNGQYLLVIETGNRISIKQFTKI